MKIINNKPTHVAMRCITCDVITVFPKHSANKRRCAACDGRVIPTGEAMVGIDHARMGGDMTVHVSVDGIDEAIEKMKQLELATAMAVGNIKVAQKLLGCVADEAQAGVSPSP